MKSYGKSRTTTASPERVWAVWSDPNNWSAWNSGIKDAHLDGVLRDGAVGTMTTDRGSTHTVTFLNVVAPKGYSLTMAGPPLTTMTFSCSIEPNGSGSTISQSVMLGGPLGFLFGAMMGTQMAEHFVAVLDDVARTAESAP